MEVQWILTWTVEWWPRLACLGLFVVNDWDNGFGSFFGGDGFDLSNCRCSIPLDRYLCTS